METTIMGYTVFWGLCGAPLFWRTTMYNSSVGSNTTNMSGFQHRV